MSDNSATGFLDKNNCASKIKKICIFNLFALITFALGNLFTLVVYPKEYDGFKFDLFSFLYGLIFIFSIYIIFSIILLIVELSQLIYKLILICYHYFKKTDNRLELEIC